jgi:hypothetical protein
MADEEVCATITLLHGQILTYSQGASPRELIFESCRRNNTSLLEETIADIASTAGKSGGSPTELVAQILNTARDGVGNGVLHVAATYGSCEFLDWSPRENQEN